MISYMGSSFTASDKAYFWKVDRLLNALGISIYEKGICWFLILSIDSRSNLLVLLDPTDFAGFSVQLPIGQSRNILSKGPTSQQCQHDAHRLPDSCKCCNTSSS